MTANVSRRPSTAASSHPDETASLIAAKKVDGTSVYNAKGEKLGSVHDVMIDKRSGKIAYAVMSFGGFLGIGEKYHPLPWHLLTYDEAKDGYNIDVTADRLRSAPSYAVNERPDYHSITDYYG